MCKSEFVKKCGELLSIAKPNLVRCEYRLGKEIELTEFERLSGKRYCDDDEYVIVICENRYRYVILVSGNSLCAIAAEIFGKMTHK